MGCGVPAPPKADTVGYRAVLAATEGGHSWRLTLTNDTKAPVALNATGIDLVALDPSGRIIGTTRWVNADAKVLTIPPATSWSEQLSPTATDCSRNVRPASAR